jgi:hypothetical protein
MAHLNVLALILSGGKEEKFEKTTARIAKNRTTPAQQ